MAPMLPIRNQKTVLMGREGTEFVIGDGSTLAFCSVNTEAAADRGV